ncbi:Acetylxylan esterase [Bertholletia excelsa]
MEIGNSTQKEAPPPPKAPKQIFILSGQSNMAGRGGVTREKHWDGVVPLECRSDPAILRLNAQNHWEKPAREPLHADIDTKKVCGVGPGMSFANAVRAHVAGDMGLVPCAVGGTAINEWARGSDLYQNMIKRTKLAAANGGEIQALLWYQGESDTLSEHEAKSYKAHMEKFIHDARADLNCPSLPIIQVAIASGEDKYIEIVREAQKSIDLPNVVCVDARGLALKEDNLHLTTEAQVQLGGMFADAYLAHFAPKPQTPSSSPAS